MKPMNNPMQAIFPISRRLNIELKVIPKMHFHQVLVANFEHIFMIQMTQFNDPFF
jgi:hypothetical protein